MDDKKANVEIRFSEMMEGLASFYNAFEKVTAEINARMPKIVETLEAFGNMALWVNVVNKLAKEQIVFTDDLTVELACNWSRGEDISEAVEDYYFGENHIQPLIDRIGKNAVLKNYHGFYIEILESFQKQHYQLACIGLFALLDGVLSDLTNMATVTNYKKRIGKIESAIREDDDLTVLDRKFICVSQGIKSASDSMFCRVDFAGTETGLLNRHWLQHGRTHRTYTRMDFLKALLLVDGILFFAEQGNPKSQIEEDKA